MPEKIWWCVKVYDKDTGTTTTLSKCAVDEDDIYEQLQEDGWWEFVSATPENPQE